MRQLDFDYGTTVPIIIFIYHDPLVQSIHISLLAAVYLSGLILENHLYNGTDWTGIQMVCIMIRSAGITSSPKAQSWVMGLFTSIFCATTSTHLHLGHRHHWVVDVSALQVGSGGTWCPLPALGPAVPSMTPIPAPPCSCHCFFNSVTIEALCKGLYGT